MIFLARFGAQMNPNHQTAGKMTRLEPIEKIRMIYNRGNGYRAVKYECCRPCLSVSGHPGGEDATIDALKTNEAVRNEG